MYMSRNLISLMVSDHGEALAPFTATRTAKRLDHATPGLSAGVTVRNTSCSFAVLSISIHAGCCELDMSRTAIGFDAKVPFEASSDASLKQKPDSSESTEFCSGRSSSEISSSVDVQVGVGEQRGESRIASTSAASGASPLFSFMHPATAVQKSFCSRSSVRKSSVSLSEELG